MSFPAAIGSSCSIPRVRPPTAWSGSAMISDRPSAREGNEKDISDVCSRFHGACGSSGWLRALDRAAIQNARRSSAQDHEERAGERDAGPLGESLPPEDRREASSGQAESHEKQAELIV